MYKITFLSEIFPNSRSKNTYLDLGKSLTCIRESLKLQSDQNCLIESKLLLIFVVLKIQLM